MLFIYNIILCIYNIYLFKTFFFVRNTPLKSSWEPICKVYTENVDPHTANPHSNFYLIASSFTVHLYVVLSVPRFNIFSWMHENAHSLQKPQIRLITFVMNPYWKKITGSKKIDGKEKDED